MALAAHAGVGREQHLRLHIAGDLRDASQQLLLRVGAAVGQSQEAHVGDAEQRGGGEGFLPARGIGVAPLRYAMEEYADENCTAIFGYRSKELIYAVHECRATGANVVVCTDDGSFGVHGLVTLPLREMLEEGALDCIMACGPTPMLRAVQALALEYGVEAQLSLEEHMGCGIGACLTCNCKVKARDGAFGYKRVCADGPVLDAKEVVFG